jgi:hypothetical protein
LGSDSGWDYSSRTPFGVLNRYQRPGD